MAYRKKGGGHGYRNIVSNIASGSATSYQVFSSGGSAKRIARVDARTKYPIKIDTGQNALDLAYNTTNFYLNAGNELSLTVTGSVPHDLTYWSSSSGAIYPDALATKVGIGTTKPLYTLVVSGSAPEIQIKGNTPRFRLEDIDGGRSDWTIGLDSAQNGLNFAETAVADNVLFLESGGDVGIGTSSPARKLHLSTAGTTFMKFTSDDTQDWSIGANSTAGFTVYDETDSLYRFSIIDGGNVGIGKTSRTFRCKWSYWMACLTITGF